MAGPNEHLIDQLTEGFEVDHSRAKPWTSIKNRNGRVFAKAHNGVFRGVGLWLEEPNEVSVALGFEITNDKKWRGGRISVTQQNVKDCRRALLAAKP
jgi:hypothetical protein